MLRHPDESRGPDQIPTFVGMTTFAGGILALIAPSPHRLIA
jgi:hypothetical protein